MAKDYFQSGKGLQLGELCKRLDIQDRIGALPYQFGCALSRHGHKIGVSPTIEYIGKRGFRLYTEDDAKRIEVVIGILEEMKSEGGRPYRHAFQKAALRVKEMENEGLLRKKLVLGGLEDS